VDRTDGEFRVKKAKSRFEELLSQQKSLEYSGNPQGDGERLQRTSRAMTQHRSVPVDSAESIQRARL
jgi:hypothetical protein